MKDLKTQFSLPQEVQIEELIGTSRVCSSPPEKQKCIFPSYKFEHSKKSKNPKNLKNLTNDIFSIQNSENIINQNFDKNIKNFLISYYKDVRCRLTPRTSYLKYKELLESIKTMKSEAENKEAEESIKRMKSDYESKGEVEDIKNEVKNKEETIRSGISSFNHFLETFDYCEEYNFINYKPEIIKTLNELEKKENNFSSNNNNNNNISSSSEEVLSDKYFTIFKKDQICTKYFDKNIFLNSDCKKCNINFQFVEEMYFSSNLNFLCKKCNNNNKKFKNKNNLKDEGNDKNDAFDEDFETYFKITKSLISSIWSKKEEYYLLKGLSIYQSDWDLVSQFVNQSCSTPDVGRDSKDSKDGVINNYKKTKENCIFHFVIMPIFEFISDEFTTNPFTSFTNQITTLISYVSTHIDPTLGSKMAIEILKELNLRFGSKSHPNLNKMGDLNQMNNSSHQMNNSPNSFNSPIQMGKLLFNNSYNNQIVGTVLKGRSIQIAKDILKIEIEKYQRIVNVRLEAKINLISLKIQTLKNMRTEMLNIKDVLLTKSNDFMELLGDNLNKI